MANKLKLTEEQQKQLLFLKSTFEMHCKTREEAEMLGKTKNIDKIDKIIDETVKSMSQIDPNFARKCVEEYRQKNKKTNVIDFINENESHESVYEVINENEEINKNEKMFDEDTKAFYEQFADDEPDLYAMADEIKDKEENHDNAANNETQKDIFDGVVSDDAIYNNVDPNAQYDLIPLPSKGECYKTKIDRIPVGYLTAADENLITSPNLYESGSISQILLKKKILNKDINVDDLVSGDVDAIMVFLRGTSYGNDFPIVATDPRNGKKIDTTVDLSKLKYKPFTLRGDENGHFDFTLPRSGAKIKFKFLTKKEENLLQKLNRKERQTVAVFHINDAIEKIKNALKTDDKLNDGDRTQIIEINKKLQKWSENLSQNKKTLPYTKTVTNTMEMQIVSINGNTDRKYIHNYILNMPASDSLAFRRYVYDNQPGVDFEIEVERPVSDGGGTFNCFLEWDDYVFWHIA